MRRETIASAGLVSALVLTGCSSGSHEEPRPQLPQAIARTLPDNILQFETNDAHGIKRAASAVRVTIGHDVMLLTAAHMLNGGIEQCASESATQASTTRVYSPSRQTPVTKSNNEAWNGMDRFDAAVIKTSDAMAGAAALRLAAAMPHVGEKLLLANYQEKPDNNPRSLDDGPALFEATVIGMYKNKIAIATGKNVSPSYGEITDNQARSGSSGGAAIVMDEKSPDYGKVAGLSVGEWNGSTSMIDIEYHGLKEGSYKVSFLEPTTETIGRTLAASMVSCDAL